MPDVDDFDEIDEDELISTGEADEFSVFPLGPYVSIPGAPDGAEGENIAVRCFRVDGDQVAYAVLGPDDDRLGTVYLSPAGTAHGEDISDPPRTFTADDLPTAAIRLYLLTTYCDHGRNLDEPCSECGRRTDAGDPAEVIAAAVAELRDLAASGPLMDPGPLLGAIADRLDQLTPQ